jgi:ketosteroid isomerase-like protein
MEEDIWATLHRHLKSIFDGDSQTYLETTDEGLSLFEWFVAPHRQDGLDFHHFMIERSWAGTKSDYRYDLLEPRLQLYGDTAIVSYTFMLSRARPEGGVEHRTHNESRVLIQRDGRWRIVHVHKSPAWQAPFTAPHSTLM